MVGAAILAGGQSRRMGDNKAFLRLRPGGPTIIETVIARLAEAGFSQCSIVTNNPEEYAFLGVKCLLDDMPNKGPLSGIFTALSHSSSEHTLIVACDMPLLNPDLLRYMASLSFEEQALVPRRASGKGQIAVEPLHSIYARLCLNSLEKRLSLGDLSVTRFLEGIPVRYIDEPELKRFDPSLQCFRNVNTPEEWNRLQSEVSGDG